MSDFAKGINVPANDCISRQAAIDALDVLCQEHRYKIPGKRETYSQYNEAWQDALDRAEGAIFNLPSAQPERKTGRWYKPQGYPRDSYRFICDNCHDVAYFVTGNNGKKNKSDNPKCGYRYCPNCGADMRESHCDDCRFYGEECVYCPVKQERREE